MASASSTNPPPPPLRFGIDLGGTKTEILALDKSGQELFRRRVESPRGSYASTLRMLADLVAQAEQVTGQRGSVGIGIPGALSPASGLVKNANSTWLIGHPLDQDLSALLQRPVRLANDADCFALSEASDGAGMGEAIVFGVILGTGVGGGIVVHGRLLQGANAIAGEWGHNPLPWPQEDERPGPACYCGRSGCIEGFLSGPALARDHALYAPAAAKDWSAVEIAASIAPSALAALSRYEERLARALASVINLLDPHVIVLGGGMSKVARLYQTIPALWDRYIFSDQVSTSLLPARHGDSSGVRGAAWLWP